MKVFINQLDESELKNLTKIFREIDKDQSGMIEISEL